ncbi:MAG: prolipoprotein diacylglyceryl transferase [Candidatus Eremiobacterota bacterium]
MHRILFTLKLPYIGPLDIYTYGVVMVIGFIIALTWALKYSKPKDIKPEEVMDFSIYLLISGIIGARLIHVIINYNEYSLSDPLTIINLRKGGLAWYGALIGAIAGGLIYSKVSKISFWKLADMVSAPSMVGLAIGRIGCFLNGCCYGKPTDLPCGVEFPETYPPGVSRHPTQIYESILDLVVFYILHKIIDKNKKFYGETFCYFIGLYSLVRFIVEFFRETFSSIPPVMGLTVAQLTGIGLIIIITIIGIKISTLQSCKVMPHKKNISESLKKNPVKESPGIEDEDIMICKNVKGEG